MHTISVIIPNYNNEKYINECIKSVVNQDCPIKEIIVYDDASTDSSVEILKKMEAEIPNLRVIYASENRGVSYARDYAIRIAGSDYISVLDGDDYYYNSTKICAEMKVINENPDIMICAFSQTVDVDENGHVIGTLKHKALNNPRFKTVTRLYGKYCPRDFIFPKEAYLKVGGYRKDMKLFEDWELSLRLMSVCEFKYSYEFGTAYRHKLGGLSKTSAKDQYDAKKKAFELNKDALKYTLCEKLMFNALLRINYIRAALFHLQ